MLCVCVCVHACVCVCVCTGHPCVYKLLIHVSQVRNIVKSELERLNAQNGC